MGKLNFIKTENIGPLLHYQLIFIFTVNVAITSFYLWKYVREQSSAVKGWIASLSAIFLTFIYDDILHRLTDISYFYSLFFTGTCVVIGIAIIVSLVVKILNKIFNIPI